MDHRRGTQNLKELLDDRVEQRRSPAEVTEGPGAAQVHPEQLPQQVVGLFQRDPQVRAAIAGQQPCARADVGARQFEIATTLTRAAATATLLHMASVTMQLDPRPRDIFDQVIVVAAGLFQVLASAVRTAFQPHVVIHRVLLGNRRLAKHARMFAMRLLAAIGSFLRVFFRVRLGAILLAAPIQFRFEFGVARSKFRVLPLQPGYANKQFFNLLQ